MTTVQYTVLFNPSGTSVTVPRGVTLLEAAGAARIAIDSACAGDGICGRCKMIVRTGKVGGDNLGLLTREQVRQGFVLACQATVESDLVVDIPEETRAKAKIVIDRDAQRFRAIRPGTEQRVFDQSPIVTKLPLKLNPPTLADNLADYQRIETAIEKHTGIVSMQAGLKILRRVPEILRAGDFTVTATIGRRRGVAEVMDIEPGDTSEENFIVAIDIGTSTVVAHLLDVSTMETVGAQACFNSQATFGREVTKRMIAAEQRGPERLQEVLIEDINRLIGALAAEHDVKLKDITAVVCAGNTAMIHFLLGLPTRTIRRTPYVAVTAEPPPFRAAEVGIRINSRGLLFALPSIGGWVGADLTAGILATGLHEMDGLGMLIDIGTNGEIVLGNREWLMACSASTGPALEGASVGCGMIALRGAIERVRLVDGEIAYDVIGGRRPEGICGSGIIDLLAVLLAKGVIDRSGKFIPGSDPRLRRRAGQWQFVLVDRERGAEGREIVITQEDIDNIIVAKAAVFAAAKILLERVDRTFADIDHLMIAGGFGNFLDTASAVAIGLLPDIPAEKVSFVGNTSIWGAKLAALSSEARRALRGIVRQTTCYDLMGSDDYVEQFRQAMFLPHTNIELFPSVLAADRSGREGA